MVLYSGETNTIQAVTSNMYRHFGVSSKLANGIMAGRHEFTIETLFPEIHKYTIEALKSPFGTYLTIDSTGIEHQAIFINDNKNTEDSEQIIQEEDKPRVYRTAKVKVWLVEDKNIEDTSIRVLRFQERNTEDLGTKLSTDQFENQGKESNNNMNSKQKITSKLLSEHCNQLGRMSIENSGSAPTATPDK